MFVVKYPSLGGGYSVRGHAQVRRALREPGPGNKLQARLTMTDASHNGEPVTIEVDGTPHVVTIDGFQATL